MVVGSICATVHGLSYPLMIVFFGDMTDSFIESGKANYL